MPLTHTLKTLVLNAIGERVRAITGLTASLADFATPQAELLGFADVLCARQPVQGGTSHA
jgi:hypothetical protein